MGYFGLSVGSKGKASDGSEFQANISGCQGHQGIRLGLGLNGQDETLVCAEPGMMFSVCPCSRFMFPT